MVYNGLTPHKDTTKIIENWFKQEKRGNKDARENAEIKLKKYLIKTDDNSQTLMSDIRFGKSEGMHTYHGAITESMEKFVKPSKLENKDKIRVLDICSGLGYNAASTIEYFNDKKIQIDMIEISKETLGAILLIQNPLNSYYVIKKAVEDKLFDIGALKFKFYENVAETDYNINIYIDDARKVVEKLKGNYDAIFLDPFSPSMSPELYSLDFMYKLKNLLNNNGVLLTYTAAAPVRSAIALSGLHIGEGPAYGRKNGGTICSKNLDNIDKPLSMDDERMIALSDAGIPFRDSDLNQSSLNINNRRQEEREQLRGVKKLASTVKTPIYLYKDMGESRLKRRVLRNIESIGINNNDAKFLVCPQYEECICKCGCAKINNSRDRIIEMTNRLNLITN